jgi:hypothetical protein
MLLGIRRVEASLPAHRCAVRTISSLNVLSVRRMASEDSDHIVPGFLAIHGLHDRDDFDQSISGEMSLLADPFDALRELLKIRTLCRPEWMLAEERYYRSHQIRSFANDISVNVLSMVVVPLIRDRPPTSKNSRSASNDATLFSPCVTANSCET